MSIADVFSHRINNYFAPQRKASIVQQALVENLGVASRSNLSDLFFTNQSDEKLKFIEQYKDDLWVYICINRIAQSASKIPIKVFRRKSRNKLSGITKSEYDLITKQYRISLPPYNIRLECFISKSILSKFPLDLIRKLDFIEELDEPDPLVSLLNKPNPFMSKYGLIEGSLTYLELRGDSFVEMVGLKPGPVSSDNPPVELWHHNPDNIIIIPDPKEYIKGYVFDIGTHRIPILKENILHFKYFNPTDLYYGQGTLEALSDTLIQRKNIISSQKNFFKQGMKPSGVLEHEESLSNVQYDRLWDQLIENFAGVSNFHKPLLLEGGLKWASTSITQKDADLIATKKLEREDFLAAFGVPPILVGLPTENYATARESTKVFYQDTLMPKTQIHEDVFNSQLTPLFGDDLFIKYDYSSTPAMQVDRKEFSTTLAIAFKDGAVNRNEYRKNLHKVGIDLSEDIDLGDEGEQFYIPANLIQITDDMNDNDLIEGEKNE